MAKGLAGVRKLAQEREAKAAAAAGGGNKWFKLSNSGDSAIVRFLEEGDDVHWVHAHELPPEGNQRWGMNTPCLDQENDGTPCPGCEAGQKRKFQGYINLIWRDAPNFKRNEDGFFEKDGAGNLIPDGTADQVAIWNSGITVFEELDGKDATYRGLTTRDFKITRKGSGLKTKYVIEPADPDAGAVPMSDEDQELADDKPILSKITEPLEYDVFKQKLMHGGSSSSAPDDGYDDSATEENPFLQRRNG